MQCDGHFGQVKLKIKGNAKNGPVVDKSQITQAFTTLKTAHKDKLVELEVKLDNFQLKPLKNQIRKYFEWEIKPDGTCRSRERTGSGNWTNQVFEEKSGRTRVQKKGKEEEEEEEEEGMEEEE
jgi:hypothetical protein